MSNELNPTRRNLLKSAAVCLPLPFLESFGDEKPKVPPKRMFSICQDLSFIPRHFFPKESGKDYKPSLYLDKIKNFKDHFTVFSGLSHPGVDGGHRADKSFLTGATQPGRASFRNSISLDQVIANEIGHKTRFRHFSLSINDARSLSYTQAGVEIPTIQNANQLFDKMFLQGPAKDVEKQKQKLRRKASILDLVMGQSKSVLKKAGSIDRDKLDQYQTAVRSLEQRLYEQEAWEDKPKPKVEQTLSQYPEDKKEYFKMIDLMNDISTLAFQTDSTRAITLFIGSVKTDGLIFKDGTTSSDYHNISHHGKSENKLEQLKKAELAHMNCIKGLLTGLQNVQEQGGTLLDNTMVLYGSNMGDANIHNNKNLPILLAGGGFKHGQHLKYNQDVNEPLANLFLSMLHQMGLHHKQFSSSKGPLKNFS